MGVCWGRGKAGGGLPQCWVATESESVSSLFNCFEVLKCLLCHKINRKCQSSSVQYRGKESSNAKFSKKNASTVQSVSNGGKTQIKQTLKQLC